MLEDRRVTTGHLLAAVALVVLGVLIGWATDTGDGGQAGRQPGAGVGPTRTVHGVPVGYERSREGAVAAALTYDGALGRPEVVTDRAQRRSILATIATPEVSRQYEAPDRVAALRALARQPAYRATREGRPTTWQTTPLSYRVDRYTDDEAQVSSWSLAIIGVGTDPPVATYGMGTTRVRWLGGDWKFAGEVGETRDGPTPALAEGVRPSSGTAFRAQLRGLEGLRYVP